MFVSIRGKKSKKEKDSRLVKTLKRRLELLSGTKIREKKRGFTRMRS